MLQLLAVYKLDHYELVRYQEVHDLDVLLDATLTRSAASESESPRVVTTIQESEWTKLPRLDAEPRDESWT